MNHHLRSDRPIVLHICAGLAFGGVEAHLRTIALAPDKRYDHRFCAIMRGGAEAETITNSGSDVHILNVDPWRQPLGCLSALMRLIREVRPHVVHCHGLEGNFFGLPAAGFCRVPVRIGEEIGIPDRSAKMRLAMSFVYRFAHRVIGVSDAVRKWLIASGEVPASKAVRLYNPVTMSALSAQPRQSGPLRIAFLGRLDPVKNLESLIGAVELIGNRAEVELLLLGEGDERGKLERVVRTHGLQRKVTLPGFQSDPHSELLTCHLYVQPSIAEGFGIAVVEAMSCGLPAIVSDRGGMAEIVEHCRTGWVIETPDPESIATAILNAARLDPRKLAHMGERARQSVRERFDPESYINRLEQLYDRQPKASSQLAGAWSSVG